MLVCDVQAPCPCLLPAVMSTNSHEVHHDDLRQCWTTSECFFLTGPLFTHSLSGCLGATGRAVLTFLTRSLVRIILLWGRQKDELWKCPGLFLPPAKLRAICPSPFTLGRVNRAGKKKEKEAPTGLSIHCAGTGSVRLLNATIDLHFLGQRRPRFCLMPDRLSFATRRKFQTDRVR